MLYKIGQKVEIGSQHADNWGYDHLVGQTGVIAGADPKDYKEYKIYKVSFDADLDDIWNIFEVDCIPIIPTTNRMSLYLLRR
jgi:hypothetical protein